MQSNHLKIASAYRIGEVCAHFSVSARALRFYEERGLLAPDRDYRQMRLYSRRDFNRVRMIAWGRRSGLSLEEIRELLDDYDSADQGKAQLTKALDKLRLKAAALDAKRVTMRADIEQLEERLAELDIPKGRKQHAA